jgi:hypothetical protein
MGEGDSGRNNSNNQGKCEEVAAWVVSMCGAQVLLRFLEMEESLSHTTLLLS